MADPAKNQDMNPEEIEKKSISKKPKKSQKAKKEAFETFVDVENIVDENAINIDTPDLDIDIDAINDSQIDTSLPQDKKISTKKESNLTEVWDTAKIKQKSQEEDVTTIPNNIEVKKAKPDPNKTKNDIWGDISSYIEAQKLKNKEEKTKKVWAKKSKEFNNSLTHTWLEAMDGTDLTKLPDIYAIVPHHKWDHKIVYTKENMPDNLWNDLKHRSKGGTYAKNWHKIYDVHANFHRHPTLKNIKGEHLQVWVVDSPEDVENQLKAIREWKWWGTNFADPILVTPPIQTKDQIDEKESTKTTEEWVVQNENREKNNNNEDKVKTDEHNAEIENQENNKEVEKDKAEDTQTEENKNNIKPEKETENTQVEEDASWDTKVEEDESNVESEEDSENTQVEEDENDIRSEEENDSILDTTNIDQGSLTDIDIWALTDIDNDNTKELEIPDISSDNSIIEDAKPSKAEAKTDENEIKIDDIIETNEEDMNMPDTESPPTNKDIKTVTEKNDQVAAPTSDDLQIDLWDISDAQKHEQALYKDKEEPVIVVEAKETNEMQNDTSHENTINLHDLDLYTPEEENDISIPKSESRKERTTEIPKIIAQNESLKPIEISDSDSEIRINEISPEIQAENTDTEVDKDILPESIDSKISEDPTTISDIDEEEENQEKWLLWKLTESQKKRILRWLIWLMFLVLLFLARAIFKFVTASKSSSNIQIPEDTGSTPKFSDIIDSSWWSDDIEWWENEIIVDPIEQEKRDQEIEQQYKIDLGDKLKWQRNQLRTLLNKSLLVESFNATRLANGSYQKANEARNDYQANENSYTSSDLEEITDRLDLYITSVSDLLE